ncbi:MAG: hypothetical protein AAF413_02195 [Patescibacteria group bacterium]
MAGSHAGGRLARDTNKKRHGSDFYQRIGKLGGMKSKKGGFASNKVGKDGLTGRERAKLAGARGGRISRRTKAKKQHADSVAS